MFFANWQRVLLESYLIFKISTFLSNAKISLSKQDPVTIEMTDDVQYPSDTEEEWRISTNGSEFAQSAWSYSNLSVTTEQWVEDVFMGSAHDHILEDDDTSNNVSRLDGLVRPSSSRNLSFYSSTNIPVAGPMSPTPAPGRGYPAFRDEMWTSGSGPSEEYRYPSASPQHLGTYPSSNQPWDPVGHSRVMQYNSGDVAFADSPKSSSDQSFCEVPSGPNVSSMTHATQDVGLESVSLESPGVANQQQLRWEVVSVATYGPPRNDNMTWRDANRRQRKGRTGPLGIQKAKDAHVMRKLGVCWPCRVSKVKASFIQLVPMTTFSLTNVSSARQAARVKPVETINHPCRSSRIGYVVGLVLRILKYSISPVSSLHLSSMH